MAYSQYEPMQHHKLKDHWRVAMWIEDGNYKICVAKDYVRTLTESTLPIFIKMKLPFAKANYKDTPPTIYQSIVPPDFYICPDEHKELENIAWQVEPNAFILVLHQIDLDSLRGGTLTKGDEIDTRSKSKKESKTNSRRPKVLSFFPSNWRIWEKWST
jgi:hypothetical protein